MIFIILIPAYNKLRNMQKNRVFSFAGRPPSTSCIRNNVTTSTFTIFNNLSLWSICNSEALL